jgi:transcriptional regulator with XRE-family HTH domain
VPVRSPHHAALGQAIKEKRNAHSLSQERLAALSNVDRTYVGGIERGECNPSYGHLLRIATTLNTPVSELLARAEELRAAA